MPRQLFANTAAIATGHPLGAAAGLVILQDGGNAIDAAVAAMLAMCVVVPGSVGLGGYGGSAVICRAGHDRNRGTRLTTGKNDRPAGYLRSDAIRGQKTRTQQDNGVRVIAVDFDSRAPLGFQEGIVTADPQSSYYGARAVTVPAVVAGLDLILREFGTKSWSEVSQPAIRLAQEGFEFDDEHQRYLDRCAPKFDRQSLTNLFGSDTLLRRGDSWRQPDLAGLLRQLADDGVPAFYEGEIPKRIVRYVADRGGILTEEDFRSYRPQVVDAVAVTCRGFEIYTPPPPSGGITSLAIAQTVERFFEAESGEHGGWSREPWNGNYFHILAEAAKNCWQERQQFLGDPDFVSIPVEQLVSKQAAAIRAEQIRHGDTPRFPLPAPRSDSSHTANVIAVDNQGNLISLTATQGWMYGSHLVVDGIGLVLNHGMSRFDYSTGHPNAPSPGKRMQHNMAPMIALRKSQPAYAFGLPGGPKIVSVTAQLALGTIAFGATPAAAITAPRLHTEDGEPLLVSQHMPASVIAELEQLGHTVRREADMGGPVNVLAIDPQAGRIDIASGETTGAVAGF
jgi:gamma-glutamyltranspeptidase / glutathione hydrolase